MIIHLTGGIGCGKSTVAAILRELGATTVDADAIVHELYERSDVQQAVGQLVGLEPPFTRGDVARRVFGDDSLLHALEAIIHPLVHDRFRELRASHEGVLVLEVPLPPQPLPGELVICVEAPDSERVRRLRDRGMQDADIFARIAAAPGPLAYREHASLIIDNAGDLEHLRELLRTAWEGIRDGARTV